jgi:hypothetical protein
MVRLARWGQQAPRARKVRMVRMEIRDPQGRRVSMVHRVGEVRREIRVQPALMELPVQPVQLAPKVRWAPPA